jgi:hypothetical protein
MTPGRLRAACRALLRRAEPDSVFQPGEVGVLDHSVSVVTRPEDGHTVVRWILSRGDTIILSVDVRAEAAREYAEQWARAAHTVEYIAPNQDWSHDPIRDAWQAAHRGE